MSRTWLCFSPDPPRPLFLLSFAFVYELSAVFIFAARFGFCLLDHTSNHREKTVDMGDLVVLKYVLFIFVPCSVSGCVWAAWGSSIWQSLSFSARFHSNHSEPCSSICFCAANNSPYLNVMQHSTNIGQLPQNATTCHRNCLQALCLICHTESAYPL